MTIENDVLASARAGRRVQERTPRGLAGLYDRPGFKLRRAHQAGVATFGAATADFNITTSQYGAMHVLAHVPNIDQITLAGLVGLDRSTTSMVLGLLEERGLIERAVHSTDRRRRTLELTQQGWALFEAVQEPVQRAIARLTAPISAGDRERFLDLLERLVQSEIQPVDAATAAKLRGLYRRPGFLIRRAHQISSALFIRECQPFDSTPTQYGLLFVLQHQPALDQVTLARLARFDRSTNAMVVGLLEQRGLIARTIDRDDRRRRVLNLTPAGHQMLKALKPGSRRARQQLLRLFDDDEQAFLMRTLDSIIASFEAVAG